VWGGTIVLVDPFKHNEFSDYLLRYKPQHVYVGPPHIRSLRDSIADSTVDLSFLEFVASGGAGMPYEEDASNYLFFAAHGADGVYGQGYGLSEVNAAFCWGIGRKNKIGFIGIPLAGNDAAIVDPETLEELPYGEDLQGLLMIRTPTVMLGYHGIAASKDKDIFTVDQSDDLWVSTGDICTMDESGKIKIIDRVGRGFNTFGMNIYPSVIENVLGMHSDVVESVIVGIEHELMGVAPVANVVVAPTLMERTCDLADELDELIARELPSYTRIYAYRFRTSLPYTSRAKPNYQLIQSQGIDDLDEDILVLREVGKIEDVIKAE
jgi:Acyl-CoA synthetases (AMP-forming)/AMP-acid ligases II